MRFKLYSLLHIFGLTAVIQAAFKDFIIEDERDLERFRLPNNEMYDDDDVDYNAFNAWPFGDDDGGGSSCDAIASYDTDSDYTVNIENYEGVTHGQIDASVLRELLRQMENDPRFKHIRDHLYEENFILEHEHQDGAKNFYIT